MNKFTKSQQGKLWTVHEADETGRSLGYTIHHTEESADKYIGRFNK